MALFLCSRYNEVMLNRQTIHNSAMLRPQVAKRPTAQQFNGCPYFRQNKRHALTDVVDRPGKQQCVECGVIKPKVAEREDYRNGVY